MKYLAQLFAVLHAGSGLVLLLFSGWFIAACAIAGYDYADINFNYLLPAVIIRALALTRIASGYAQMWVGHRALLSEVKKLRMNLFQQLKEKIILRKAEGTEALAKHSESIASVNMAWTAHNLGALFIIAIATVTLIIWLSNIVWIWCVFIIIVCLIFSFGFKKIITVASRITQINNDFRHNSEHHLHSVSLWHLREKLSHTNRQQGFALSQQQQGVTERMLWWVQMLAYIALIAVLTSQEYQGKAVLLIFILLLLSAKDWLGQMIRSQTSYADYRESQHTFNELPTQAIPSVEIQPQPLQNLILNNFSVAQRVVPIINLEVKKGQIVLLKGGSGIGKSSILQAIAGLIQHTGEKIVNDEVLPQGFVHKWYYAEQMPQVLSASLASNISIAKPDVDDTQMYQALAFADLSHLTNLSEWLGTEGRQLSGGELKRLNIARAYLFDAELYLLDEPFEGLDYDKQEKIAMAINELSHKAPVIIASHIVPNAINISREIVL